MTWVPLLLREDRRFRRFWAAQTVSLVGDQVTAIALPLVGVLAVHANAIEMGYLTAAAWLPYLLFSLHAGAWVDRRGGRRRLMVATDLCRALVIFTVPIAWGLGSLALFQLYAVAFLSGTLSVVFSVANSALFVALVPRDRYLAASSLLNGSRAFSFVGGPSLGGLLVQLLSAPFALAADALSFLISAVALSRISATEPPREEASGSHLIAGIRFVLANPVVRGALAATATINLFNFALNAVLILYVTTSLHVAPGLLGVVLGAGAVGGVVGSIVTGRIARWIGFGPAVVAGCILFPAPLILIPLAGGPNWLVLLMLFLAEFGAGFGVMVLDITINTVFSALIPGRLRARVTGAYGLVNNGVRPVGALLGGSLGAAIGLRSTLWFAARGAVLGALWLIRSPLLRMRGLPELAE